MTNKLKPIQCWAVIYDEQYDDDTDVYLPKLFATRSEARQEANDCYPYGFVRRIKISVVKGK